MQMQLEVLANYKGQGAYGKNWSSFLVRRGDKYYAILDHFVGQDEIVGGAYRPFLYEVPAAMLDQVKGIFAAPDAPVGELGATNWTYLHNHLIGDLVMLGRAYGWAVELRDAEILDR